MSPSSITATRGHRWRTRLAMSLVACGVTAGLAAQRAAIEGKVRASFTPERPIASSRAADLDGDGRMELLVVGVDGDVEVWKQEDGATAPVPHASGLVLPRPEHSVLALADLTRDGREELIVYDDRGVRAYALDGSGSFGGQPLTLVEDSRMRIRVGRPTFAAIVRDLNGDDLPDLVLPIFDTCQLWLNRGGGEPARPDGSSGVADASVTAPRFELAQTVPVPVAHRVEERASNLADLLENKVRIPRLDIADVNGDGRPDLRARDGSVRRFFLQDQNGHFAATPIEVDLSMFRDTTPEAGVELGKTVVLEKHQQMQAGDLNGDGIPDYVIAHRRKVWSFLADAHGPQFKKADTRVVAEDISGLLLMHLDDDDRDDLFIFKVDAPTAAELVLGLVSSIDVPIHCIGYRTAEDGTFERRATWKRTLTLRIPSIARLLSEATDLVQDFMGVLSKLRWSTVGDFDGDGHKDLALVTEDESAMELWRSPESAPPEGREIDVWLRKLFFEDPDTVFDVDRLLKLAAQVFDARTSSMTGKRDPDARVVLPVHADAYIVGMFSSDFDGDGRDETVVVSEDERARGVQHFDVIEWR